MKKNVITILIITIIILIIAFIVFLNYSFSNAENTKLAQKTEQEIRNLEEKIIEMMNSLNHINFSNAILTEDKIENNDENSNKQKSSENSNENTKDASSDSKQDSNSSQKDSQSSNSSSSSNNTSNKTQGNDIEQNVKYELKNSSVLTNKNIEVDWEYIKSNTEMIYSIWPTILMDLHELNVNNQNILDFTKILDQVTLSVSSEDKVATLNNMAVLYSYLSNYKSQFCNDNKKKNVDNTITCILNSYALCEQDNWDEMRLQLSKAIEYYTNIMNSVEDNKHSQSHISKTYVLLNELINSIDTKNKELYYIKYRNTLEELIYI